MQRLDEARQGECQEEEGAAHDGGGDSDQDPGGIQRSGGQGDVGQGVIFPLDNVTSKT